MNADVSARHAEEFAIWVVRRLREAGYESLWAGGCVRDRILGIEPSDYDVATSATPDEVRDCFGHGRTLAIGAAFGVITVRGRRGQGQIEVATFRSDACYSDGRHPDHVTYSTAREDAQRRDFTMNGLFYDPLADRVIDYVGGVEDLQAGIVRAIGDPFARIAEDKLRMLRAVRFATRFGFRLDPDTASAIQKEADQITLVSGERIGTELRKMLVHPRRAQAARILRDVRLLAVILPEVEMLRDGAASSGTHDVSSLWETTLGILDRLVAPTVRTALAALLWGIGQHRPRFELIEQLSDRWKLSGHERKGVTWMLTEEPVLRRATQLPWHRVQRVLREGAIDELLTLADAIVAQLQEAPESLEFCRRQLRQPRELLDPPPLITGDDLQRAGYVAGPLFRAVLEQVRDAQLDQQITTPRQALDLACQIAQRQEVAD